MSFLGRVLRFLFWVLLLSWVMKLLGRALGGTAGRSGEPASADPNRAADGEAATAGRRLVKDAVCGMHIAEELALSIDADGETHYFCSPECRAKFESSMARRASA